MFWITFELTLDCQLVCVYSNQHAREPQIFGDFYAIADTLNRPSLGNQKHELYGKIIEEDYAYVDWNDNIDLIMKEQHKLTGRCNFETSKEKFLTQRLAFAFPKNNPWVEKFNTEQVFSIFFVL